MRLNSRSAALVLVLFCTADTLTQSCASAEPPSPASVLKMTHWPQFRGPNAQGVSPDTNLPAAFDPANNVVWKTPVPPGNSSPCIWGDAAFLTAFEEPKRLLVLCLNAGDGQIRWQREVPAERIENVHPRLGSPAQASPTTDGERLYVFFGSVGLVCFDLHGKLLWRHELGPFSYNLGWGAASSPVLFGNSVILNCDHDGESFVLAIDRDSGGVKWRTSRPDAPASYSTPVLWPVAGQTQLVVAGSGRVTAYDAHTGSQLWRVEQPGSFVATTPVVSDKLLFVAGVDHGNVSADFTRSVRTPNFDAMFGNHDGDRDGKLSPKEVPRYDKQTFDRIDRDHDGFLTREELQAEFRRQQESGPPVPLAGSEQKPTGNLLAAIRPGGRGDVTASHVVWRVGQAAPYVPSPLLYDEYLHVVRDGGIVACFEAATGKLAWRERLGGSGAYYASPVAGDGKIYVVNEHGEVTVLAAGPEPRVLSRNPLGERCLATPAIVGGRLYVRTETHLYCIGKE